MSIGRNYKYQSVKFVPEILEPDTIYVSKEYNVMSHLCPCGCLKEVVLKIGNHNDIYKVEWMMIDNENGTVTFIPSVQVLGGCWSHYHIVNNEIVGFEQLKNKAE
jgi:hypothetical protein